MPHPTPEQLAAAAAWFKHWRQDDSRGHPESLAELLAEREQTLDEEADEQRCLAEAIQGELDAERERAATLKGERDIARASADVNRKLADSYLAELRLLRGKDATQLERPHPEQPSLSYCPNHEWPFGHGPCRCAPCPHCTPPVARPAEAPEDTRGEVNMRGPDVVQVDLRWSSGQDFNGADVRSQIQAAVAGRLVGFEGVVHLMLRTADGLAWTLNVAEVKGIDVTDEVLPLIQETNLQVRKP